LYRSFLSKNFMGSNSVEQKYWDGIRTSCKTLPSHGQV
jgi:hypothetical protein